MKNSPCLETTSLFCRKVVCLFISLLIVHNNSPNSNSPNGIIDTNCENLKKFAVNTNASGVNESSIPRIACSSRAISTAFCTTRSSSVNRSACFLQHENSVDAIICANVPNRCINIAQN